MSYASRELSTLHLELSSKYHNLPDGRKHTAYGLFLKRIVDECKEELKKQKEIDYEKSIERAYY